jgi:hypothetical protein
VNRARRALLAVSGRCRRGVGVQAGVERGAEREKENGNYPIFRKEKYSVPSSSHDTSSIHFCQNEQSGPNQEERDV